MARTPGRILGALARLLVRGPDAPFILGDMEEAMRRDVARGVSPRRARLRYVTNALASGLSLARFRFVLRHGPRFAGSWLDVKLGWRMLWKTPVLTAVAVLALAVGIPVGLAPVHLMNAFDAPPPVPEADRLMGLRYQSPGPGDVATTSYDLGVWRQTLTSFGELGAVRPVQRNLGAEGEVPVPVAGAEVTASVFSMLRVRPLLGRTLQAADEAPGAPPVVLLSYDVWQSRFAAAGDVVGSTVRVAGVAHTVVGVMPEGFLFPVNQTLWLPLRERSAIEPGQGSPLLIFGRLADRASMETAESELAAVGGGPTARFPESDGLVRAEVVPLTALVTGLPKAGLRGIPGLGPFSFVGVMQALALLLLVVACANVGLLIFARTATRSGELVVRTALGASRTRLIGQIVIEAFVLALLAAGAGLLLIDVLTGRLLMRILPSAAGGLPWWVDVGVNAGTVVYALALAVCSAVIAALIPALRVTGSAVRRNLNAADSGGFGIRFGGVWSALIIADVAFAVAALGLTVAVNARMQQAAAGRQMETVAMDEFLSAEFELPEAVATGADAGGAGAGDAAARQERLARIQRRLVERLEAEPGVRAVAVADRLPRMDHANRRIELEDGSVEAIEIARVDPGFFDALGQSILAGRGFDARDLEGDRSAVVVNRSFANELAGGANPVGRRVRYLSGPDAEPGPWLEIVGLIDDLGTDLLQPEDAAAVYQAAAPGEVHPLSVAVRTRADPASFAPRLREVAAEVDPEIMVLRAVPMRDVYPEDWSMMAGFALGWGVFVVVLLALAGSGIYALMAFAVAQRTREIGIRTALGARATDIAVAIGRRAAVQLLVGAVAGMPVAGWLYFQIRADPTATLEAFLVALLPGLGVVLLLGLAACTVPLRRALRVPPTQAIRGAQ